MSSLRPKPNVKLAKLLYKYADEAKHDETDEKQTDGKEVDKNLEEEEEYESYPPYNFSWLVENKIAGMGWPQTVGNLNYLADVGVNHLITLSPEMVPPILECKKKLKWTKIAIEEFGVPTMKQILKFIEICERAQIRGEAVGVHCRQGRGRTGTMLACYLVHFQNMAPERAVLTVRVQRPGSVETYEQENIVCYYHDCLRGTVTKPDYRLVDEKLYFDYSMKYSNIFDDDKSKDGGETSAESAEQVQNEERLSEGKDISKAMVINHKIYF